MKNNSTAIEGRSSAPCSRSFGGYEADDVGPEWDDSPHEPKQAKCGTTHYAGCACHEQGWENKWKAAIEMAALAEMERDELRDAVRSYRDAKGRYHTQLACERLVALIPDNAESIHPESKP